MRLLNVNILAGNAARQWYADCGQTILTRASFHAVQNYVAC